MFKSIWQNAASPSVVWIRRFSNGRRHWWRHSCDVTHDVTVVTSLMTSLMWRHCRRHHRIPNIVTSLLTSLPMSLLWRHYRHHGWRYYCDITIVQHASHITKEFSDTWASFGTTQFRRNGNISIFSDILPNPQNVIRVRLYRQTDTQTHHVTAIPLTSPILNASRRQREKCIPIVSHHCHVVQNPAVTVTRTHIPDRCTSSHAATHTQSRPEQWIMPSALIAA